MALKAFRAPPLPIPPKEYNEVYFRQFLRTLELYFGQLDSLTPNQAESYTAEAFYGNLFCPYVAVTATYAILPADCVVDCTSGTFTATLPTAVGVTGKEFMVKNSGAGTITVATTGGQTIDGAATTTSGAGVSRTFVSTGANWILV